jgi:succinyl-diaminopimelate desuccinylase
MTVTESASQASETLRKRLVEITRDLILIPSTVERPEEIERCMEFVIHHGEVPDRVAVHRYREGNVPCTVFLPTHTATPTVLLLAHLDVVSLPSGTEYGSSVRDGRIYGPGAGDMKGELAILIEVFRAIHERYSGAALGLAVTSDEERGGTYGTRFLFEHVGLRCGAAIVPDSGSLGEVAVEEKGTLHVRIVARGAAGHGSRPWLADNACDRIIAALGRIRRRFDAFDDGDPHWHPTCTFTVMETRNRVPNRIPDRAEAICDIRFPAPHTVAEMQAAIEGLLDQQMDLEVLVKAEPTDLAPDPLYLKITEEIIGRPVRLIREHGGSDARYIARYGIPVIMTRPYVGNLHTEDEWVEIASMETLYRIYETYIVKKLGLGVTD